MTYDFKNAKNDTLTKPRDLCWDNWFKFEKVGDSVQGFIRDVFFRPSDETFGDQRGLTLEQPDGKLINVGIKHIDFVLSKTDGLRLGDPVTIEFEKESPNANKAYSATKILAFYGKNLDENKDEKTVAQLEAEDRNISATEVVATPGADFDPTMHAGEEVPFDSKQPVVEEKKD